MGVWGLGKVLSKEATMSHFLIGSGKGFIFHQCLRESFIRKKLKTLVFYLRGGRGEQGVPQTKLFLHFPLQKILFH